VLSLPEQAAQQVGDYPAGGLWWEDANAYCRWLGKRLPTDVEWELAGRGAAMSRYPWGNGPPSPKQATVRGEAEVTLGLRRVCTMPAGNTSEGLCDMADNIPEYVDGWIDYSDGWRIRYDSVEEERYFGRIVKGCGNTEGRCKDASCVAELWDLCVVGMPRGPTGYYGVRCAMSSPAGGRNRGRR
jgi:formylglycine-generating enzyme required for sulfatase activity